VSSCFIYSTNFLDWGISKESLPFGLLLCKNGQMYSTSFLSELPFVVVVEIGCKWNRLLVFKLPKINVYLCSGSNNIRLLPYRQWRKRVLIVVNRSSTAEIRKVSIAYSLTWTNVVCLLVHVVPSKDQQIFVMIECHHHWHTSVQSWETAKYYIVDFLNSLANWERIPVHTTWHPVASTNPPRWRFFGCSHGAGLLKIFWFR